MNEQVDSIIRNSSRLKEIIESLTSVEQLSNGRRACPSAQVSVSRASSRM
jgi:hypothetical protein